MLSIESDWHSPSNAFSEPEGPTDGGGFIGWSAPGSPTISGRETEMLPATTHQLTYPPDLFLRNQYSKRSIG